jgi:hypothetical protein
MLFDLGENRLLSSVYYGKYFLCHLANLAESRNWILMFNSHESNNYIYFLVPVSTVL